MSGNTDGVLVGFASPGPPGPPGPQGPQGPAGPSGGGGGSNVFVYREGATPAGNVYATFGDALTAASATQGLAIIEFDPALGAPQITAGTYAIRDGIRLIGTENGVAGNGGWTVCEVRTGVTFTGAGPLDVEHLQLLTANLSAPNMTISGGASPQGTIRAGSLQSDTSSEPLFAVTGSILVLAMLDGSLMYPNAGPVITADGGSQVVINMSGGSALYSGVLSGAGAFTINCDASCIVQPQPGITGTMTIRPLAQPSFGTFAGRPNTAGAPGNRYVSSDGVVEFVSDGTNWRPYVGGVLGTSPPPAASWTLVNAPTSLTDDNGTVILESSVGGAINERGAKIAIPSPPYTLTAIFSGGFDVGGGGFGISLHPASGSSFLLFNLIDNSGLGLSVSHVSSPTSGSTVANPAGAAMFFKQDYLFRIQNDGTNRVYSLSSEGRQWSVIWTEAAATFLTETFGGIMVEDGGADRSWVVLKSWDVTSP